jgi:hypothetical protein
MEFLGNYKDWIDPLWLDELLSNQGTARPKEGNAPIVLKRNWSTPRQELLAIRMMKLTFICLPKTIQVLILLPLLLTDSFIGG